MLWKSVAVTLALMLGTYLSASYSLPIPNPEDYKKVVRPFNPDANLRSLDPQEYCYYGVVYVGFYLGNATWGSAKFDSKTKQVVTCK